MRGAAKHGAKLKKWREMQQPKTKKPHTGRRVPRRTSVGVNGPAATDLLFRLGSLTAPHLAEIASLSKSSAQATLQNLRENGICDQRDKPLPWREERRGRGQAHYFLSKKSGGTGVLEGAASAGVETRGKKSQKKVLDRYSFFGVPEHVTHCWLRNEFYVWLLKGARSFPDRVLVPTGEFYGESCAAFPLGVPGAGSAGREKGTVRPDGRFDFGLPAKRGNSYVRSFYVEAETNPRRAEAKRKTDRYLEAWWSVIGFGKSPRELVAGGFGPTIFVYPDARVAKGMRDYVRRRLDEEQKAADADPVASSPLKRLRETFVRMGVEHDPGRFILFVGMDEIHAARPGDGAGAVCGAVYRPLVAYPDSVTKDEDGAVVLTDVLRALHGLEYR